MGQKASIPPPDYQAQTSDSRSILVVKVNYSRQNPDWEKHSYQNGSYTGSYMPPMTEWQETRVLYDTPVEILRDWEELRQNPLKFAKKRFGQAAAKVVSVSQATLYRAGEEPVSC